MLLHVIVFLIRLPIFGVLCFNYFTWLQFIPMPLVLHKIFRWNILIMAGIFFVDIQVDGVKRGSLSSLPKSRIPHPRSVIASNFTSPIDAMYMAAIFDPIFVQSYPGTRKVRKISLAEACMLALRPVDMGPPDSSHSTSITSLLKENPDRIIAVFPECTTTNGRAVLPLSYSLLGVPPTIDIFPLSIRYTLPDVTTPVPERTIRFFWDILSRPSTYLRVRLADALHCKRNTRVESLSDSGDDEHSDGVSQNELKEHVSGIENKFLDSVADTLARLGRNKRVGLTLQDKAAFTRAWHGK